jgi:hypothetical protein
MSITDLLIVLACLAVGYWIVHSVISSDGWGGSRQKPDSGDPVSKGSLPPPEARDWHIVLDIPRDASHRDIQAAMKRRLVQADANGDAAGAERIRRAAEYGLRLKR